MNAGYCMPKEAEMQHNNHPKELELYDKAQEREFAKPAEHTEQHLDEDRHLKNKEKNDIWDSKLAIKACT